MALGGVNLYQFGHFTQSGAAPPSVWTMRPSRVGAAFAVDAAGDTQFDLTAGNGSAIARAAWFSICGEAVAATGGVATAMTPVAGSTVRQRVTATAGATNLARSAMRDSAICFAGFGEFGPLWGRIVGIGSVVGATGLWLNVPMGALGVAATTGAGVYTITLPAGRGLDPANTVLLATPRGQFGANNIGALIHVTQTAGGLIKNIETIQRNAAGFVATNTDFDVVLLATGAGVNRGAELFAAGSVANPQGGAGATLTWQGPRITSVLRNAIGLVTVTLSDPIDAANSVVMLGHRGILAGGVTKGQVCFGYARTDTTIQVETKQEPIAAGVMIRDDIDFDIAVFRLGTANEYVTDAA